MCSDDDGVHGKPVHDAEMFTVSTAVLPILGSLSWPVTTRLRFSLSHHVLQCTFFNFRCSFNLEFGWSRAC